MNPSTIVFVTILFLMLGAFVPNVEAQCFAQQPELEILNVSEPGSTGLVTVSVRYKNVTVVDVTWQGIKQSSNLSGATSPYGFDVFLTCMTGPSDFIVEASNCAGSARVSRSLGPLADTGRVTVTAEERGGVSGFHAALTNPFMTITKVRSHFFPVRDDPEMGQDGPVSSLDSFTATRPGTLKVIATWCPSRTGQDAAAATVVDCHDCNGSCVQCPGEPVQVTNGNMRFTETDPIPGAPVVPFRRNYDSRVPESGWFGPGTTTFLDPRLYVSAEGAESAAYISLMDEDGHGYVFEKKLDTYVQFSPRPGSRPTRLLHDANGEWRHVNSDGRIARVFSADGRLLRYVDQRTGRATLIDFDTLGRPAAVRDSWGTWSWTLTFNTAVQRITRIAVDGPPDIVWDYVYGSNQNHVVRVESPTGTWRRYDLTSTPAGSVVSAVRDGTGTVGHVLESHSFDGAQRATTSFGPSGEIS
ncbi:MAG: hypothetical protein QOH21_2368, partial [Acidobacteriota bacterium]|nr:hypothetical protein [Acidobacteriota bacterium]